MIKHIVFWTFHESADGRTKTENIRIAIQLLEELRDKIPVIKFLETGTNINSGQESFDLVLYTEFENEEGLKTYQNHPEHLRVIEFLRKVRDKRAFVDYKNLSPIVYKT